MKKILNRIWFELKRAFFSLWWVLAALIVATIAGLIWGLNVAVFTGLGLVAGVIAFVFLRQIWWFVWGSEKGDYPGRVGLLKRLICLIFKIKIDEDKDQ